MTALPPMSVRGITSSQRTSPYFTHSRVRVSTQDQFRVDGLGLCHPLSGLGKCHTVLYWSEKMSPPMEGAGFRELGRQEAVLV